MGKSCPGQDALHQLTPNSNSPATTTSNISLKPPSTPTRSFWDTPVGRSLDGSSGVGWESGGGSRNVISGGSEVLGGPSKQGAGKEKDGEASSSTAVVDADVGAGADAGIDSPGLDDGLPVACAGEEEKHSNPRGSSLPTPPIPPPSPSPSLSEKGVGGEQVTVQGNGAKAVRSLSRGGGGGGRAESMEMGAETPDIASESEDLLSGAHASTSRGELGVGGQAGIAAHRSTCLSSVHAASYS